MERSLEHFGLRPVYQTREGYPRDNSYEACLSTMTGIPLEELDAGSSRRGRQGFTDRWRHMVRALRERGLWINGTELSTNVDLIRCVRPHVLCGLGRSSLSGLCLLHSCVASAGRVIHNPSSTTDLLNADSILFVEWLDVGACPDLPLVRSEDNWADFAEETAVDEDTLNEELRVSGG